MRWKLKVGVMERLQITVDAEDGFARVSKGEEKM